MEKAWEKTILINLTYISFNNLLIRISDNDCLGIYKKYISYGKCPSYNYFLIFSQKLIMLKFCSLTIPN